MLAFASLLDQRTPSRLRREFVRRLGNVLIVVSGIGLAIIYLPFVSAFTLPLLARSDTPLRIISARTDTPRSQTSAVAATNASMIDHPTLIIPKLAVEVPVVADVDGTNQFTYNTALKQGVAQMKGTAPLDATSGNTFIFGHSSRFASSGTPYDTVFAALSTLDVGDDVTLATPVGLQAFRVTSSRSTGPNDTSVLDPTDTRVVTIETCWPLGTTLGRWVVRAEAI